MQFSKSILTAIFIYLLLSPAITGCANKPSETSEEDFQEDWMDEEEHEQENEEYEDENTGTYELTFRGDRNEWPSDQVDFSLHIMPLDSEDMLSIALTLNYYGDETQSNGGNFTLYTDSSILDGIPEKSFKLVHAKSFADDLDCFDKPAGCNGIGTGIIGGTQPNGSSISDFGIDNDLHTEGGTLTITKLEITGDEKGILEGLVSGYFELSGINTNASKPNPGHASGRFTDAPFSTLKIE